MKRAFQNFLARWSILAVPFGAALGWRLQGLVLTIILAIVGYAFCVWANDWEVREMLRKDLAGRAKRRIGA